MSGRALRVIRDRKLPTTTFVSPIGKNDGPDFVFRCLKESKDQVKKSVIRTCVPGYLTNPSVVLKRHNIQFHPSIGIAVCETAYIVS